MEVELVRVLAEPGPEVLHDGFAWGLIPLGRPAVQWCGEHGARAAAPSLLLSCTPVVLDGVHLHGDPDLPRTSVHACGRAHVYLVCTVPVWI